MATKPQVNPKAILPLLLLSLAAVATSTTVVPITRSGLSLRSGSGSGSDSDDCVYTLYIRTGSVWKGGTDSIISVDLLGADGTGVRITNLEAWGGLMGEGHDYYERGNLDIFSGRGPCMASPPPCLMNLTSDGSGSGHGWYCNYVEVTTTGPHIPCAQQLFTVEQWLATDRSPHELFAVRNLCGDEAGAGDGGVEMARDMRTAGA